MRTITRWVVAAAGASLALLTVATATALGGGAAGHFDGYHEPGDIVVSRTAVSWSHNTDLGTPDDGPYLVYMAPMASESESTEAGLFAEDQRSNTRRAVRFDTLWVGIVGVVSSLLVGWIFRSEALWNRVPTIDRPLRNETRSRDVLTDE